LAMSISIFSFFALVEIGTRPHPSSIKRYHASDFLESEVK